MSFNTRSGRGRGVQQAQMTFHQTPPRLPSSPAGFPNQFQQMVPNPLAYRPAPVDPVVPVVPSPTPAPAQPAPPGVVPPSAEQQQQPQTPATPQFKTLHQVKMECGGSSPVSPTHSLGSASQMADIKESTETRPWKKLKNPSFKVNKVLKRRRLNARFRKLLFPKNAIMVLNELQPGVVFEANETTNALSQISYHVKIDIDGEKYTGEGSSKASAKAAAAELAVKGIILKKIAESSKKDDPIPTKEEEDMDTLEGDDMSEKGSSINGRRVIPEDEVPWGSLASFALFKLFAEWKTQGSVIPPVITPPLGKPVNKNPNAKNRGANTPAAAAAAAAIAAGAAASATYTAPPGLGAGVVAVGVPIVNVPTVGGPAVGVVPPAGVPAPPKPPVVPDNADTLHPVTLVGRIFHGTAFAELSRVGTPPNLTFTMGCVVNGIPYQGVGKSKKEAKKQCAIEVLKAAGVPCNAN